MGENAGPNRALVAETLLTFPVVERRISIQEWLETEYGTMMVGDKSVTTLIMSDIESYPELTMENG